MAVEYTDLKWFGAQYRPTNDADQSGGSIETAVSVQPNSPSLFNYLNDYLKAVSSDTGDTTQTLTVEGIKQDNTRDTENININGTTTVSGVVNWLRLEQLTLSAACNGSIDIKKNSNNTSIFTLESGVTVGTRLFLRAQANPSSGVTKTMYECAFIRNTHATDTLTSGVVKQISEPESRMTFALFDTKSTYTSATNRLTSPPDTSSFDDSDKTIPTATLGPGEYIQVWFRLVINSGDPTTIETASHVINGVSI